MPNSSSSGAESSKCSRSHAACDGHPLQIFNLNAPIPYLSFEQRLQTNHALFAFDQNPIGDSSCHHESDDALSKYQDLCLRGFIVQGYICAYDFDLAEAKHIIDSVGWIYIVMHVRPFCHRVVRECISKKVLYFVWCVHQGAPF